MSALSLKGVEAVSQSNVIKALWKLRFCRFKLIRTRLVLLVFCRCGRRHLAEIHESPNLIYSISRSFAVVDPHALLTNFYR